MPIILDLWRLGEKAKKLESRGLDQEEQLESLLFTDPSVISPDICLNCKHSISLKPKRLL